MYICVCNAVTERQIRDSVAAGARTLSDLQFNLGVASCCGCCADTACGYLPQGSSPCADGIEREARLTVAVAPPPPAAEPTRLSSRRIPIHTKKAA